MMCGQRIRSNPLSSPGSFEKSHINKVTDLNEKKRDKSFKNAFMVFRINGSVPCETESLLLVFF